VYLTRQSGAASALTPSATPFLFTLVQTYAITDCGESHITPVSPNALPIVFGQSAPFSGPALDLGTEMRRGIRAAFNEVCVVRCATGWCVCVCACMCLCVCVCVCVCVCLCACV